MNKLKYLFYVSVILGIVLFTSCGEDEIPDTAIVKGTITLMNNNIWANWVDSGEVQLTVFPAFSLDPPSGWGQVPDNFFGPGVPGGTFAISAPYNAQNPVVFEYNASSNTYEYELELEPGFYSALALGFRHDSIIDPSRRSATLGVHWGNPGDVSHGIVIKIDIAGVIMPIYNYPAPSNIQLDAGDELTINFMADFAFVEEWY